MTTAAKKGRPLILTLLLAGLTLADSTMVGRAHHVATTRAEQTNIGTPRSVRLETYGANESARSNKIAGGPIQKAALESGRSDIKITVNVPAFLLTLWQEGKEIETYTIGIGLKSHPVIIGEREATQIIYNPRWIPPDSMWVRRSRTVRPGEVIRASDSRNPLGKIKIPLGEGYLLHQAAKPSDIGRLVSHGCIRMLRGEIVELTKLMIRAQNLKVSKQQLEKAKKTYKRLVIRVDEPVPVDINYDTIVVEGTSLHIYPDVYGRGTNSVESLRAELQAEDVDTSGLTDVRLKQMIGNASKGKEFSMLISDLERLIGSYEVTTPAR